ncbi:MAG: PspA/IM30 family protein, partial [Saccharothrix sp.]|nr:PspA/IM30 family protein [Saccharothrix sp.]
AAPSNVPSLEEVRDKIETRYTTALGSAELAQNSVQGRMLEVQQSTTELAGQSRLEQIRASMAGGKVAGEVTSGQPASASIQQEIQQRVQQSQSQPTQQMQQNPPASQG